MNQTAQKEASWFYLCFGFGATRMLQPNRERICEFVKCAYFLLTSEQCGWWDWGTGTLVFVGQRVGAEHCLTQGWLCIECSWILSAALLVQPSKSEFPPLHMKLGACFISLWRLWKRMATVQIYWQTVCRRHLAECSQSCNCWCTPHSKVNKWRNFSNFINAAKVSAWMAFSIAVIRKLSQPPRLTPQEPEGNVSITETNVNSQDTLQSTHRHSDCQTVNTASQSCDQSQGVSTQQLSDSQYYFENCDRSR